MGESLDIRCTHTFEHINLHEPMDLGFVNRTLFWVPCDDVARLAWLSLFSIPTRRDFIKSTFKKILFKKALWIMNYELWIIKKRSIFITPPTKKRKKRSPYRHELGQLYSLPEINPQTPSLDSRGLCSRSYLRFRVLQFCPRRRGFSFCCCCK